LPNIVTSSSFPGPARHGHFVRFYDDDTYLLREVAEYIDAALRAGGAGIVIATPEHLAGLHGRLAGFGTAWYPGELITLDARETLARFVVEGWPDETRFFDVVGSVAAIAADAGRTSAQAAMAAAATERDRQESIAWSKSPFIEAPPLRSDDG